MKLHHFFFIMITTILTFTSCENPKKQIIWVNGYKTHCDAGAGKKQCLQVSKSKILENAEWELCYSEIEGFQFESGQIRKIEILEETIENPPADASSIKYTLIQELQKIKDPRSVLEGTWIISTLNGEPSKKTSKTANIVFMLEKMQVSGINSCNRYMGGIRSVSESSIELGNLASTKMACMGNDNIEREFSAALGKVTSYKVENDLLTFYNSEKKDILSFTKSKEMNVVGGWSDTKINDNVKEALKFALEQMNDPAELNKIINAKRQVVKGYNYDIVFSLKNNSIWKTRVYQNLKGNFELLEAPQKQN